HGDDEVDLAVVDLLEEDHVAEGGDQAGDVEPPGEGRRDGEHEQGDHHDPGALVGLVHRVVVVRIVRALAPGRGGAGGGGAGGLRLQAGGDVLRVHLRGGRPVVGGRLPGGQPGGDDPAAGGGGHHRRHAGGHQRLAPALLAEEGQVDRPEYVE